MQPNMKQSSAAFAAYNFDPEILREYDIRGQIGKNLSTDDAFALGRAFGSFVIQRGGSSVAIGYDGRVSSPDLAKALTQGLMDVGINVKTIGRGPTPMLYFSVKNGGYDGGIMVTGSHNPPDYNGFKMMLQSEPVFGAMIQEIGKIAAEGAYQSRNEDGSQEALDIQDRYVARLIKDLDHARPLKIAWDNGNGAAGDILQKLVAQLPGEHILLYEDIDGTFPNHHPDPTVDKNLIDLQRVVDEQKCDLGIAFDGDGDRIGVVDENGTVLRCDILMTIYARAVLETHPGASIIGDVKCSSVMFDTINNLGGKGVMWKTGHSLIKDKMRELNSPLAGELSGHIFFADRYYGYDDALYCAVRLINALPPEIEGGLSSLTKDLPELYSTAEVRFDVDEAVKFDIVPHMHANLKTQNLPDVVLDDIDGVRVNTPDGWWICRPSNTQSVLVARAEGTSPEGLERLKSMASQAVANAGYSLTF